MFHKAFLKEEIGFWCRKSGPVHFWTCASEHTFSASALLAERVPRSTININITTTLPLLPPSPIDPSSPLVSLPFPPQVPSSHPIISIKTKRPLKAIVVRSSKCSPPSTTVKITFHLVMFDTSPCKAPLDRVVLEGTSSALGFYSLASVVYPVPLVSFVV